MAIIPEWFMYIVIFIFAAFYGKRIIKGIISFFQFLINDVEEMIDDPKYYFKDFFEGEK